MSLHLDLEQGSNRRDTPAKNQKRLLTDQEIF